jgi:hypothetical protein
LSEGMEKIGRVRPPRILKPSQFTKKKVLFLFDHAKGNLTGPPTEGHRN